MAFTVLYDTCALYPTTQRNLLIRLARSGLVRARWSAGILEELDRNLAKRGVDEAKRVRLFRLMNAAVSDCLVEEYEPLIDGLKLPDPGDCHVLAAAIKADAQVIVTNNLRDFPEECLKPSGIEARSPDDFVLDLIDINDRLVHACVQQIVDERRNPPESFGDALGQLERSGLIEAAAVLRLGQY
ncbi:MAG TPA: PIN domain-containing protein [Actinospica sp.]|nr:PIN domain-containing protein [Actinospica sp.]